MGSWVVYGEPAGICVREDIQNTTDNDSCFVPHVIVEDQGLDAYEITTPKEGWPVNGFGTIEGPGSDGAVMVQ